MNHRKFDVPQIPIKLSEIESCEEQGFVTLQGIDAAQANGDFFRIMERRNDDGSRSIKIVCPTFLRGSLGFAKVNGSISY